VELCVFLEPQQGASYDQQLAVAQAAEALGFAGLFRSDHVLHFDTFGGDGRPGPTDAWVTLAGLARETSRIRLGTLVSPVTFRLPGMLALQVAQVDRMSGGRVELGLGAGWNEAEHRALGIPFPSTVERFDQLEEQLAIVTGLLGTPDGETFSYSGAHYTLTGAPALPKPVQRPVPLIMGGGGKRRTPELVARYATEFNIPFVPLAVQVERYERIRAACADAGRDPADLRWSTALTTAVGRDADEVARRVAATGQDAASLAASGLVGTPDDVVAQLCERADAGTQRMYLQILDLDDLAHLELIAAEVLPRVG
jgi:F420-dependent oxidoreductase-like protein